MTERTPRPAPRVAAVAVLACGLLLSVLAGFGGAVAVLAGLVAQPLLGLGLAAWRGSRPVPAAPRAMLTSLRPLLLAWGGGLGLAALLLAWPLQALRGDASLGAALGTSTLAALLVLALWRSWPVWRALEADGGSLAEAWRRLPRQQVDGWAGLGAAVAVALLLGGWLLLAWPGQLPVGTRWILAVAWAAAGIPLHLWLQRTPAPAEHAAPLDFLAASLVQAAPEPLPPAPEDPHALVEALYAAARGGRVDQALQLLEAGADPHVPPPDDGRDRRSLAVLAAVLPDLRLLRALIARGIDLNPGDGAGPLLAATRDSWHGRPEAVMTLLANGADPRATDAEGNTPLHHAARSTDPGVAALLRDAAAELEALNRDGLSPLAVACAAGNWRLARFLLERGAHPEPAGGQPVLLAAAGGDEDDAAGVQLLLKFKARVGTAGRSGRTALHEAALAGHSGIAGVLLAAGADPHRADAAGRTPWLEAARGLHVEVLGQLLAAGVDVAAVDGEGRNAVWLAAAAEQPSLSVVRRLLEAGVDPAVADAAGRRAVDVAAEAGRWAIVAALDPAYPLPLAVAEAVNAAPAEAEARPPLALVREGLLAARTDGLEALARLCNPAELGGLLHEPVLQERPAALAWLLEQGADPESMAAGHTVLSALLARGGTAAPAIQQLLRHGASPAGAGGLARFLAACVQRDDAARAHEQLALDLFNAGADPFAASPAGDPALALAVRLGWLRLLEALLEAGVDREARDSHGMTALHLAAALGRESALRRLVAQGASPEARAADGQTPLGVALASGRRDLADWLDWRGWALPGRPLRPADVAAAAMAGDADAVRRLLDLGFAVDATDAQGCTGLLRGAGGGHAAVVDLLLSRGADPQHAAASGATPLSAAVSMRQVGIVSALLDAGAEIEHRLPGGVTVLMLASALGLADIAARLLTAGADIAAGDGQGLAPLHCAALYGFTGRDRPRLLALLDTLLLAGAEPDQPAAGGVTPLLLLLGARAEPGSACDEAVVLAGLERLLEEDVLLDAQDPRGFGPLHLAALHGLGGVVQRLLRAGADPDLRDTLNRPPREIAVMRGFIDVAAEFVPAHQHGGLSMARFLHEPRG